MFRWRDLEPAKRAVYKIRTDANLIEYRRQLAEYKQRRKCMLTVQSQRKKVEKLRILAEKYDNRHRKGTTFGCASVQTNANCNHA